ncbi:MAG: M48 family metallopeptidase [Cellvibrionales bacterium]|jgi:predicted metal-dependent hydrolase|nr:M48 family metallopeptidase [Cellvibrionales bacterium]MBT5923106.1 M48 family metallopeptidase [Cellvibrionales bacterium]MBT6579913.1 M48 family metallopeptidase [Cellvibrionales bacterium]
MTEATINNSLENVHNYKLIRTRRRTLGISVRRGIVEVRAPLKAPKYWINECLEEKRSWISKQVSLQKLQLQDIYRINDGAILPLLGDTLSIRISNHSRLSGKVVKRASISVDDSILWIDIPPTIAQETALSTEQLQEEKATQLFLKWIKTQAESYMSETTQALAKQMNLDKLNKISYRRTASKWGHCTSEGNIQYNPLLMLAPQYVVDYIIAHEVCHLRHANHSKQFWNLVDNVYPQRNHAENWLKQHGHRLAIV